MQNVIGVRFQEAGKIYYFAPAGFEDVEVGEYVVVETSRGLELARVVIAPSQVVNAELTEPLKPIVRMAWAEDLERAELLKARAREDVEVVRTVVRERDLPMKVVNAGYNLDGSRLTVYFMSESRVDFRDLLRDLSRRLGTQVQLRQVGPRDQAKVVDGYGRCGRRLCCAAWLTSFPAISIKMAKDQDLPLNPSKISGECGRLLCCLAYEDDTYKQLKSQLPRPGMVLSTPHGGARVLAVNTLRQMVTLQMETMEVVQMPADALAMELGVVRVVSTPTEAPPATPPAPPPPDQRNGPAPRARQPRPAPVPPPAPASNAAPPPTSTPAAEAKEQPAAEPPAGARRNRRGAGRRRRNRGKST